MMDIKGWFFRMRIFIGYILTEPFITIYWNVVGLLKSTSKIGKPKVLHQIFMVLAAYYYFVARNMRMGIIYIIATLLVLLKYEWDSGMYMYKYRQKMKKKRIPVKEDKHD